MEDSRLLCQTLWSKAVKRNRFLVPSRACPDSRSSFAWRIMAEELSERLPFCWTGFCVAITQYGPSHRAGKRELMEQFDRLLRRFGRLNQLLGNCACSICRATRALLA